MITPQSYLDRDDHILALARGKRVLHLGCVGFTCESAEQRVAHAPDTLHYKLTQVAQTIGVDLSADVVGEYRRLGIFDNIVVGNVEQLDKLELPGPFDLIVAADIVEHLSNPGAMLDSLRSLCSPDTRIVITTPHAFGLPNFMRYAAGRFTESTDHVTTFNVANLENLLGRYGYVIEQVDTAHQSLARRHGVLFTVGRAVFRRFPKLGGTLFVVARAGG